MSTGSGEEVMEGAGLQGSWDGAGGGGRKGREWHLVLAVE